MPERLFHAKRCKVHERPLERDTVPVRIGLIRFRAEYREAARVSFPHASNFVLGGCRIGSATEKEVLFCPECREAEAKWREDHPDFDCPNDVYRVVAAACRDLPDSLAKRILRQGLLSKPEKAGRYLWIVCRLKLTESVAYDAEKRRYQFPFGSQQCQSYGSVLKLARAINTMYE